MKKRKESFWGLHFDFHAQPTDKIQGLNEDDIREICHYLKPDFIQIDCKGHPGWTSYASELGNAVPNYDKDTLALWRKVTREEEVALYMHYSGVYERKYCAENPDERVLMGNGTRHSGSVRLNGSYVDGLLIPQLKEIARKYDVNGVWIDGDCWMALADFTLATVSQFEKETGIDLEGKLPTNRGDKYYEEYREFNRELFRRYVRHYTDEMHKEFPDFEVCSNWAFSDHMPEEVSANVDFLSGDLNPMNSFNSARYAARALAQQEGHPWDLMSWNFRNIASGRSCYVAKHPIQLMQEAAAVISVGGAYQNYVPQNRDGTPKMWELRNLKALSEFVLERKDFCHRAKQVHQAALFMSTYDRHHESEHLFSRTGYEKTMGLSSLLCDIGQSLEIVYEHTLKKHINEYKMIVVPELYYGLEDDTVNLLLDYAKNGGNLVITGKKSCHVFAEHGAPYVCEDYTEFNYIVKPGTENGHNNKTTDNYKPYCFTTDGYSFGAMFSPCRIEAENGEVNALFAEKPNFEKSPLSVTVPYGKGKIVAIGFDIGSQYLSGTQYLHRELIKKIADGLYDPIVSLKKCCGRLEISVTEKDGRMFIQLVNAGGTHADMSYATDDYIPPVLDIELELSLPTKVSKLILQPEGTELSFEYETNGKISVSVSRVDIHSIIEIK